MINNNKIIKTSLDKNGNIVLHYLNNKNEIKKTKHNFSKLAPLKIFVFVPLNKIVYFAFKSYSLYFSFKNSLNLSLNIRR